MNREAIKVVRRATLWIPGTGPVHDRGRAHLFVVLTEPEQNGSVLVVPICSADKKCDQTCIVGIGDHHCLTHKSYVAYHKLGIYSARVLEAQILNKVFSYQGLLDVKVFAFVCDGVSNSREAAPKFKNYYATRTKNQSPKNV